MRFSPVLRSILAHVFACACVASAPLARADRLIDDPTARKLPFGDFRLEYSDELSNGRTQLGYLDLGIGTSFEASIRTEQIEDHPLSGTLDLTYNYISPLSGIAPGLALGVDDLMNTTEEGRRFFLCATYRDEADVIGGSSPLEVTVGAFFANRSSPYVALSMPFSGNVRFIGEADDIRLTAGMEYRPNRAVGLRVLSRGRDLMGSVSWRGHF